MLLFIAYPAFSNCIVDWLGPRNAIALGFAGLSLEDLSKLYTNATRFLSFTFQSNLNNAFVEPASKLNPSYLPGS